MQKAPGSLRSPAPYAEDSRAASPLASAMGICPLAWAPGVPVGIGRFRHPGDPARRADAHQRSRSDVRADASPPCLGAAATVVGVRRLREGSRARRARRCGAPTLLAVLAGTMPRRGSDCGPRGLPCPTPGPAPAFPRGPRAVSRGRRCLQVRARALRVRAPVVVTGV